MTKSERDVPVLVQLRTGEMLEIRGDVPTTRGECPTTRPCGHVRCRHHLWIELGPERRGRTARGYKMSTTLHGGWLEDPPPPSCVLDIAEAVKPGELGDIETIARAIRQSTDWARRLIRRALRQAPSVVPTELAP